MHHGLKWALIVFCVLFSTAARAQFTQVSGTVTDPNGVPYALGTITAHLVVSATPTMSGSSFDASDKTAGLDRNGSFAFQLADNTQISPGSSTYTFTVCSGVGTVQPAGGKGSVCFTVAGVTISGTSQSITANLNAGALALSNLSTTFGQFIDATNYGLTPVNSATYSMNATITNGSSTVTTPSTDPPFTAGDVGKIVFGTCCFTGGISNYATHLVLPQGTITGFINAHSITVSTTANANASGVATNSLFWGNDSTTALQNAYAAVNTPNHGLCGSLFIPTGIWFTTKGIGNSLTCTNAQDYAGNIEGVTVTGSGRQTANIMPLPNFDFTTCTGGGGACFFGTKGKVLSHFSIWGGYNGDLLGNRPATQKYVMSSDGDDQWEDVMLYGWGAGINQATSKLSGIIQLGTALNFSRVINDGAGSIGLVATANSSGAVYSFFGDNFDANLQILGGVTFMSTNNIYGSLATNGLGLVENAGTFYSTNDTCFNFNTNAVGIRTDANGTSYIDHLSCDMSNFTTSLAIWMNGAGGRAYVSNSYLKGGATGQDVMVSSGTYIDKGGVIYGSNRFSQVQPTCASTGMSQTACTITATSNGNTRGTIRVTAGAGASATGTITLTFQGGGFSTNGTVAPLCTFQYSNTGTGVWAAPVALTTASASQSAVVVNWGATAPTSTLTYDLAYRCEPQ